MTWGGRAAVRGEIPALVHGERRLSWIDFNRRAEGVAVTLLAAGAPPAGQRCAVPPQCTEYVESVFATLRAGLVPVNNNYRYLDDELVYLWDNADVVFHGSFTERIAGIRRRVPQARTWLWMDDEGGCPSWASPYEEAAEAARPRPRAQAHGRVTT